MSNKPMAVLSVLAALAVISAVIAYNAKRAPTQTQAAGPIFPELADRANDVTAVSIASGVDTIELVNQNGVWAVASKDHYPADFDQIKKLIVDLSNLQIIEEKTSNPELYDRIGVVDPTSGVSASTLVTLEDSSGDAVASLILGLREGQGADARWFVRESAQAQSYLVEGSLDVGSTTLDWLDRDVLRLDQDRVRSVSIVHADGERVSVARESADDLRFEFDDAIAGAAAAGGGNAIGFAFTSLDLEDVVRADALSPIAPEANIEVRTFDGLVLRAGIRAEEGRTWLTLHATAIPFEGGESPTAEAESFNARLGGWAFAIADHQAQNLTKRMSDFAQ